MKQHWLIDLESTFQTLFQTSGTTSFKVLIFCYAAMLSRKILKPGCTSAGHNSAPKTLCPLPYIFWSSESEPFGLDMMNHQVPPKIYHTYSKKWANCDWMVVFWAIFGDFWGREPTLYGKISNFQNLSVLGDFYAHMSLCMSEIYII